MKDKFLKIRTDKKTNERWKKESQKKGFENLSSFVRFSVENAIKEALNGRR